VCAQIDQRLDCRENIGHSLSAFVLELLDRGASVNIANKSGYTPLHYAACNGLEDLALELIERGADIHATDSTNKSVLHWAASEGMEQLVMKLIDGGADIHVREV
jgi:ankyrin repeat protein